MEIERVRRVQARYKRFIPVHKDTLIFTAKAYFTQHDNDLRQTSLAYFYSGCVYLEQTDFENAILNYEQAAQYADKINDPDLQGLIQTHIGTVLEKSGLYKKALEEYKKAKYYFDQSPNPSVVKQAERLIDIGSMYLELGDYDSSFASLREGLELPNISENRYVQTLLTQNLSVNYGEMGEYDKEKYYLYRAFELNEDTTEIPRFYLNFLILYLKTNQTDSLRFYVDKLNQILEQSDDLDFNAVLYSYLAKAAKNTGDYDAAFDYLKEKTFLREEITRKHLEQSVYEVQQKYNYEKEKNKHQDQITIYQRGVIILLSSLLLIGFVIARYCIRHKNKLLEMQVEINTLRSLEQEQAALQKEATRLKSNNFRSLLLPRLDLKTKDDRWNQIISTFEQIEDDAPKKLKHLYPALTDAEYKVGLITYAGMSVKEIGVILCLSEKTVQNSRGKLRKKIGITDSATDTCDYLKEKLNPAK